MGIPTDDRSPFSDEPSYEELKDQVAALELLAEQQAARITELEARLADLEERVRRTPCNSSMPVCHER